MMKRHKNHTNHFSPILIHIHRQRRRTLIQLDWWSLKNYVKTRFQLYHILRVQLHWHWIGDIIIQHTKWKFFIFTNRLKCRHDENQHFIYIRKHDTWRTRIFLSTFIFFWRRRRRRNTFFYVSIFLCYVSFFTYFPSHLLSLNVSFFSDILLKLKCWYLSHILSNSFILFFCFSKWNETTFIVWRQFLMVE